MEGKLEGRSNGIRMGIYFGEMRENKCNYKLGLGVLKV
jgi:hypothetical protein